MPLDVTNEQIRGTISIPVSDRWMCVINLGINGFPIRLDEEERMKLGRKAKPRAADARENRESGRERERTRGHDRGSGLFSLPFYQMQVSVTIFLKHAEQMPSQTCPDLSRNEPNR